MKLPALWIGLAFASGVTAAKWHGTRPTLWIPAATLSILVGLLLALLWKKPHHGSKTSSTEPFLDALAPRIAVISVGEDNSYGLPNAETVERYGAKGIELLQTDQVGAVTTSTDGRTLTVPTFVSAHVP